MKKVNPYPNPVFKDVSEFVDFCREHNVFGEAAINMKKQIIKLANIPLPKIRIK